MSGCASGLGPPMTCRHQSSDIASQDFTFAAGASISTNILGLYIPDSALESFASN